MTNKELQARLKEFPDDMTVVVLDKYGDLDRLHTITDGLTFTVYHYRENNIDDGLHEESCISLLTEEGV